MTETIKQAKSTIEELTDARTVQALITIILTVAIAFMLVSNREVPENLLYGWFAMVGVYMELPRKKPSE